MRHLKVSQVINQLCTSCSRLLESLGQQQQHECTCAQPLFGWRSEQQSETFRRYFTYQFIQASNVDRKTTRADGLYFSDIHILPARIAPLLFSITARHNTTHHTGHHMAQDDEIGQVRRHSHRQYPLPSSSGAKRMMIDYRSPYCTADELCATLDIDLDIHLATQLVNRRS